MTSAQLVDLQGKNLGEVALNPSVFGIDPRVDLLHAALVRQLANARSGAANTKTRAEVSGGGRKPWRQKGTGRARAGSIRSPLWAGGGVIFGPRPRDYSISMPRKVRILALKSALAAKRDHLVVVKDFDRLAEAKTREMVSILKNLGLSGKKVLLVQDYACPTCVKVERAARNIEAIKIIHVNDLNVKDLLNCEQVLTTERTLEAINQRFQPAGQSQPKAPETKKRSEKKSSDSPKKKGGSSLAPKTAAKSESKPGKTAKGSGKTTPKAKS